jgi:hypothetical protein
VLGSGGIYFGLEEGKAGGGGQPGTSTEGGGEFWANREPLSRPGFTEIQSMMFMAIP